MVWRPLLTRPVWGTKQAVSLSPKEWGRRNGYSPSGVLYLIRTNKLYAFRHAGRWYIPVEMKRR